MSGRRPHYLPRFLQKGFASKTNKKKVFTFYFYLSNEPRETSLIDIGVEEHFYGAPGDTTADDAITKDERRHVDFIKELRETKQNTIVDSIKSSALVGHLLIRNKHLRESTKEAGATCFGTLLDCLRKGHSTKHGLLSYVENNRKKIIEDAIKRLPSNFTEYKKNLVIHLALEKYLTLVHSGLGEKSDADFIKMITNLHTDTPDMVKKSHINVLKEEVVSTSFIKSTRDFIWQLKYNSNQNLILGDVGPIGRFKPNNLYSSLFSYKKNLTQVLLPVSNKHLLIGCSQDSSYEVPTEKSINEASASLSKFFFISSNNTNTEINLASLIGSKSSVVSVEDIDKLGSIIQKVLPRDKK